MAFITLFFLVTLYAFIMLMFFVGIGLYLGGDAGGMVGFILCVLIAGYGGGYVAAETGVMDWLLSIGS